MRITQTFPTFDKEFQALSFTRSAIILPLMMRLEKAQSLKELERYASCNLGMDVCFVYNGVGKLYFRHHNNQTEVALIRFTFSNHFQHSE